MPSIYLYDYQAFTIPSFVNCNTLYASLIIANS